MKKIIILALLASVVCTADFSQMTTDEMISMRGSVPVADRPAFQEEMQKRMQSLTPEERQKYKSISGVGQGLGMGQGTGIGMRQNYMKIQPDVAEYDLNNDGAITQKELEEVRAKRMKQKVKEGKMLRNAGNAPAFATMDKNNDGLLNQEEFRLHQTQQMKNKGNYPVQGTRAGKNNGNMPAFSDIDTNNDGSISQEEFRLYQSQRMKIKNN